MKLLFKLGVWKEQHGSNQYFWMTTMGSLSNNVGDGNENGKKPIDLH